MNDINVWSHYAFKEARRLVLEINIIQKLRVLFLELSFNDLNKFSFRRLSTASLNLANYSQSFILLMHLNFIVFLNDTDLIKQLIYLYAWLQLQVNIFELVELAFQLIQDLSRFVIKASHSNYITIVAKFPDEYILRFNVYLCFFSKFHYKLLEFWWFINIEQAHQISLSCVNLSYFGLDLNIDSVI